jgi:hypothetical protein
MNAALGVWKMSRFPQLTVITTALAAYTGLMILAIAKGGKTKKALFWMLFFGVLGGSLLYRAAFR